jgi:hypothetical protein
VSSGGGDPSAALNALDAGDGEAGDGDAGGGGGSPDSRDAPDAPDGGCGGVCCAGADLNVHSTEIIKAIIKRKKTKNKEIK